MSPPMLLIVAVALAILTAPLLGGRLRGLATLRFRGSWMLAVSLITQVFVLTVFPGPKTWWRLGAYLASYALAAGFLLINRSLNGFKLLALGAALNLLVIGANAGVMPASAAAVRRAGLEGSDPGTFANSAVLEHPRLRFLGDVMAVPESWPLANVFSFGDVLLGIGAFLAVHGGTGSRLVRSRPGEA